MILCSPSIITTIQPCLTINNQTAYKHTRPSVCFLQGQKALLSLTNHMIYSGLIFELTCSKLIHSNNILVHLNIKSATEYIWGWFIKILTWVITEEVTYISNMTFLNINVLLLRSELKWVHNKKKIPSSLSFKQLYLILHFKLTLDIFHFFLEGYFTFILKFVVPQY